MQNDQKYFFIVNPISGRGAGKQAIVPLETGLNKHGVEYAIHTTDRPWHAAELAQQAVADGWSHVIAVGGDGTSNEVLNGMALAQQQGQGKATMGAIPVGTGNDFSYGAGVEQDFTRALDSVLDGRSITIDIGHVVGGLYPNGRYFGNGVGIGFDAVVGFEALKLKRLRGFSAYAVAALKTISLYFSAPEVEIELDDETIVRRCLMVSIMNGRRMGGGFMMAPESQINDGVFDLCIVSQVSRLRILGLILEFMRGTQSRSEAVSMRQSSRVVVRAVEGVLPAHADGETLCEQGQELAVKILPLELDVVGSLRESVG